MEETRKIRAIKTTMAEQGRETDYLEYTPAERFGLVWPLTISVWAMKGVDISELRMDRSIERVIRRVND
jgi:hypothetical protein